MPFECSAPNEIKEILLNRDLSHTQINGGETESRINGGETESRINGEKTEYHVDRETNKTQVNGEANNNHVTGEANGAHANGNGIAADVSEKSINGEVNGNHINGAIKASSRLFYLSAFDEASGNRQAENLYHYLKDHPDITSESFFFDDLAYTLGERRSILPWKAAICTSSMPELLESLESGKTKFHQSAKAPTLGYCFTGQGAQWHGMGRELIQHYAVFCDSIAESSRILESFGAKWNLAGTMRPQTEISAADSHR